ncbi:MAG: hypothetical protein Q7S74_05480 [Nanoarchaeota archaeon]|nr:hypothetical protein [Nanoarchaeota archaeon]
MEIDQKEADHLISVLEQIKESLITNNAIKLNELSNHTIHSSCSYQDSGSITLAVVVYALSKIIERQDYKKISRWDKFVRKFNSFLDLAIIAIKEKKQDSYEKYLIMAGKAFRSTSVNLRPYIEEVIRKAAINKGSKIYEHGISLGQATKLLGITQWELAEYIGQKNISETIQNSPIDIKKRANMAMDFFS